MNDLTVFVMACAAMLLAALLWVLWPLRQVNQSIDAAPTASKPYAVMVFVAVCVIMLSVGMYTHVSLWPWGQPIPVAEVDARNAALADANAEVAAFTARVNSNAEDVEGWLLLGGAQVRAEQFVNAQQSFQKAYDLTSGQNLDAITGLAEALVLADPTNGNGRAAVLIESALKLNPAQPKALWYGGLIALQLNNFSLARDRFKALLALDPPDNVRVILDAQVARLNEQLGEPPVASSQQTNRQITVAVTLAPAIKAKLTGPMSLFVLARNPGAGGPPLAVERHQSSELPLTVQLTAQDAMLPQLSINTMDDVEVVARLSASGTPKEQPGDYYGVARYSFSKQGAQGTVRIEIKDQVR